MKEAENEQRMERQKSAERVVTESDEQQQQQQNAHDNEQPRDVVGEIAASEEEVVAEVAASEEEVVLVSPAEVSPPADVSPEVEVSSRDVSPEAEVSPEVVEEEVVICSLDPLQECVASLFLCKSKFERLSQATLRNRRRRQHDSRELLLVVHSVDGRTLLLDENGYYNELICASGGNVAVAVAGVPDTQTLEEVVAELVDSGQSSVWKLFKAKRFFKWDAKPSDDQLRQMALLWNAPPFEPTPDMRKAAKRTKFFGPAGERWAPLRNKAIAVSAPALANLKKHVKTSLRTLSDISFACGHPTATDDDDNAIESDWVLDDFDKNDDKHHNNNDDINAALKENDIVL